LTVFFFIAVDYSGNSSNFVDDTSDGPSTIPGTIAMFTLYGGIILDTVYIIPAALLHCYDVTCRHEFFNIDEMDKEV
jgi:hypothetical protein